jgi:putative hydrolase of the HAD superfamily
MVSPTLVIFDMDDVLCNYSRQRRAAHLAQLAGTTPEAVIDAIWTSGFEGRGEAGDLDPYTYLRGFGERIGYPITVTDWVEARCVSTSARPDILDLVRRVRARAQVAVLTNNPTLVADHITQIVPEVGHMFGDRFFTSARFKAAKPSVDVYHRCLALLGAAPADALFIDDLPENVAGAERAGLSAHCYTSPQSLFESLQAYNLL